MALLPDTTLYPSESLLPAAGPNVLTGTAIVYIDAAILFGQVNPNAFATTYFFEYGPTVAYGTSVPASEDRAAGSGSAYVQVSEGILGLSISTYHYRLVAESSDGTDYGADESFEVTSADSSRRGFVHAAGRGQ